MSTIKTINVQHPSSSTINVTLNNSGGVAVPSLTVNSVPVLAGPAFSASDTATTSTSGVNTKIVFDTEQFDTDNAFDGTKFQPTVAGYYSVTLRTANSGTTNAGVQASVIYKNASPFIASVSGAGYYAAAHQVAPIITALIYLNGSTDYLEFYGNNIGNANLGISYATAYLVRAA